MARRLTQEGYTVTVIDRTTRAFSRLEGTSAERLIGMGYDRGTLLEAGVERAEVLAAVTNGDNTNIVVARTAREHFQVPKVVARIYDPRRAAIYERLGISTVASAQLTTELAVRRVLPDDAGVRWVDPSANVCLVDRTRPLQTRRSRARPRSSVRVRFVSSPSGDSASASSPRQISCSRKATSSTCRWPTINSTPSMNC